MKYKGVKVSTNYTTHTLYNTKGAAEAAIKSIVEMDDEQSSLYDEWRYEFPVEGCPLCMNKAINPKEAYIAIKTISKITDEEVIELIKQYRELKVKK